MRECGTDLLEQDDVYRVEGAAAATNILWRRQAPASWIDNLGDLWLLGGFNLSPTGHANAFNFWSCLLSQAKRAIQDEIELRAFWQVQFLAEA